MRGKPEGTLRGAGGQGVPLSRDDVGLTHKPVVPLPMRFRAAAALILFLAGAWPVHGQVLDLPPRPSDAPGGAAIARDIRALDIGAREGRLFAEVARGNIPSWLRSLVPVEMTRRVDGREHRVTFRAAPDYLAVGSDDDWFIVPMSPQTAQRIADLVGASLPTPPMVDAVWAAAGVRLGPDSIPPSPDMKSVPVFEDHDRLVRARRARDDAPMGALVAGHKKDVVLTARLDTLPGRVAIYGWHRLDGRPVQPLYTGHGDRWVDYSHGVRLISRAVLIDGVDHDMLDVLRDRALAPLLSDDGPIANPRYPVRGTDTPPRPSPRSSQPMDLATEPAAPPRSPSKGISDRRDRVQFLVAQLPLFRPGFLHHGHPHSLPHTPLLGRRGGLPRPQETHRTRSRAKSPANRGSGRRAGSAKAAGCPPVRAGRNPRFQECAPRRGPPPPPTPRWGAAGFRGSIGRSSTGPCP